MTPALSVLVTPRDGRHYQDLLYGDFAALGVRVAFDEGPTPSQTLNVALRPLLLVWYRLRGFTVLHIHWVFHFSLPWAKGRPWARRLMERWFGLYLRAAALLGYTVVWTAHDLLPHTPVFDDDQRARRRLLHAAGLVIALSEYTADELRRLGARAVRVIPIGPYADQYPVNFDRAQARASFGFDDNDVVVSLIGRIEHYKGADLLAIAATQLPPASRIRVLLAGICVDEDYAQTLRNIAADSAGRVVMDLRWIPDEDIARYFLASNAALFPFRAITNSASVILAQSFGTPVVIPDLPTLSDVPPSAAMRYDPATTPLTAVLSRLESSSVDERAVVSAAGVAWASRTTWRHIAEETVKALREAATT